MVVFVGYDMAWYNRRTMYNPIIGDPKSPQVSIIRLISLIYNHLYKAWSYMTWNNLDIKTPQYGVPSGNLLHSYRTLP